MINRQPRKSIPWYSVTSFVFRSLSRSPGPREPRLSASVPAAPPRFCATGVRVPWPWDGRDIGKGALRLSAERPRLVHERGVIARVDKGDVHVLACHIEKPPIHVLAGVGQRERRGSARRGDVRG